MQVRALHYAWLESDLCHEIKTKILTPLGMDLHFTCASIQDLASSLLFFCVPLNVTKDGASIIGCCQSILFEYQQVLDPLENTYMGSFYFSLSTILIYGDKRIKNLRNVFPSPYFCLCDVLLLCLLLNGCLKL